MSLEDTIAKRIFKPVVKVMPDSAIKFFTSQYIAGENIEQAFEVMRRFRQRGVNPIFDIFGENQKEDSEVSKNKQDYISLVREIYGDFMSMATSLDDKSPNIKEYRPEISIKLSMLGLTPNSSSLEVMVTRDSVLEITKAAAKNNVFVRIDMEDSGYTSKTIFIYKDLITKRNVQNLGIALQARLRRTRSDLMSLSMLDAIHDIRLVKGAYKNDGPGVAYKDEKEVNEEFMELEEAMLNFGFCVEIATMDEELIQESIKHTSKYENANYSFSMLYGARNDRLFELADTIVVGKRLKTKVYLPYGPWEKARAYALRRVDENPSLITQAIKNKLESLGL